MYRDKKFGVFGLGISGIATINYLKSKQADFIAYDDNQENIDVSIDYTSDGYKARKLKNGKLLQSVNLEPIYYPDNPELQLIIPSLFPNYINEKYLPSMQVEIETDVNSQFQQDTYTTIEKPDPTLLFTDINLPKRDDLLF